MRLFHKLLILLLGIALVPLTCLSIFDFVETRSLGNVLTSRIGSVQIENAGRELELWVETYSKILRNERRLLELVLQFQASEVEKRLAEKPNGVPKLFFSEDFDSAANVTGDMVLSPRHARSGADGKPLPTYVSFDQVSFKLAPLVERQGVAEDIARLAAMMPVYRTCWDGYQDMLVWMFTALESGVISGYPAVGGFPKEYDPRIRPWYVNAKARGGLSWNPPYVDVLGMGVVCNLSMPFTGLMAPLRELPAWTSAMYRRSTCHLRPM